MVSDISAIQLFGSLVKRNSTKERRAMDECLAIVWSRNVKCPKTTSTDPSKRFWKIVGVSVFHWCINVIEHFSFEDFFFFIPSEIPDQSCRNSDPSFNSF